MNGSKLPYLLFLVLLLLFNGLIFLTPYLAAQQSAETAGLYSAFSLTCHQLVNRSLCLFVSQTDGSYSIVDCVLNNVILFPKAVKAVYDDQIGYKLPVCARDIAIYLSMLIGLILLPFITKIESEDWPNKWILAAAVIPLAIDGTTQLIGLRESTNFLRLVTGTIVGIVLPFYLLPILNSLYALVREQFEKKKK